MLRLAAAAGLLLLLATACGGDDDDDAPPGGGLAFDPARADELAHAALPDIDDLPGAGWEVAGTDEFGDEESAVEFFEMAEEHDECRQITDLTTIGDLLGEAAQALAPAGRANIEFQRGGAAGTIPSSVQVEVNIQESEADVLGGWNVAKSVLESDDTSACIAALMAGVLEEEAAGLFEVTLEPIEPPAPAPGDGVGLAFSMSLEVPSVLEIVAVMGLYMWPHGNAGVQVVAFGPEDDLGGDELAAILAAVDEKVRAAAGE